MAYRFTGLIAGSHVIRVTKTDATGTFFYYNGWLSPSTTPPLVLVVEDPSIGAAQWPLYAIYNQGSDTVLANYNTTLANVIAEFSGTNIKAISIGGTGSGWAPPGDLSADLLNPNQNGQVALEAGFKAAVAGMTLGAEIYAYGGGYLHLPIENTSYNTYPLYIYSVSSVTKSASATAVSNGYWLSCPHVHGSGMLIYWKEGGFDIDTQERVSFYKIAGLANDIAIWDVIEAGSITVPVYLDNIAEANAFNALRARQDVLLLQSSSQAKQWYIRLESGFVDSALLSTTMSPSIGRDITAKGRIQPVPN